MGRVVIVLACALLPACGGANKQSDQRPVAAKEEKAKAASDGDIHYAGHILLRYQQNQLAADDMYLNKQLTVRGEFVRTERGTDGGPVMVIGDVKSEGVIACGLLDAKESFGYLPGMRVTVKGKFLGKIISAGVVLDKCTIVPTPPRP